jgi:hypothetical protein
MYREYIKQLTIFLARIGDLDIETTCDLKVKLQSQHTKFNLNAPDSPKLQQPSNGSMALLWYGYESHY